MKQECLGVLLFLLVERDLTVNANFNEMIDEFKNLVPSVKRKIDLWIKKNCIIKKYIYN